MQCPKCSSTNVHRTSPDMCVCRDCLNVFDAQMTEEEIAAKTAPKNKAFNDKARKFPKLKRNDVVVLCVLATLVAVPVAFWWSNRDPYICSKKERELVTEKIDPLIQDLQDVNDLAGSTSRIALATPLSRMQEVQRNIRDLEFPQCAEPVKNDLLETVGSLLTAYLAFAADDNEFLINAYFSNFEDDLAKFGTTYQNMKDGISNYSIELGMTEEQLAWEYSARSTIGSLNRGQQAYYLENGSFSATIDGLGLGLATEIDGYRYQVFLKPEASMVFHTATPMEAVQDEVRAMTGAVAFNSADSTTEQIVCIPEEITNKVPDDPIFSSGIFTCPDSSKAVE